MNHRYLAAIAAAALTCVLSAAVHADDPPSAPASDVIYGRELMTEQEIAAQRQRMREATTEQERERIRAEHHAAMQQRAREMGVGIPETMPPKANAGGKGRAQAPGQGQGKGQGQGQGKGQGQAKGQAGDRDPGKEADAPTKQGPYGDKQKSKRPEKGG
jgi:hypothetical protein